MKKTFLPAIMAIVLLVPLALQAAESTATLLVVPARIRMIQLAFDMQSLRQAEVVAWRTTADPGSPELNYWTGKSWVPITLEQFQKGSALARKPQKVIFLGLDTPPVLVEASDLPGIARFETFDPAVLVNNLDAFYAFSPAEWRLLSKRYGFMLRDVNARVRQQNRYDNPPPPVEEGPRRPPVLFENNPPPAKVIRAPHPVASKETTKPKPTQAPAPVQIQAPEAPGEILTPEPLPSTPLEVMTREPEITPPVAAPAGTDPVPAVP